MQPRPIRFHYPREYHVTVRHYYIFHSWLLEPVDFWYTDGYYEMNDYPYYVEDGYRYRYSSADLCQYDLVDGNDNTLYDRTELMACNEAFDQCAADRDALNSEVAMDRFFCAESVDDDLANNEDDQYYPLPRELSPQQTAAIEAILAGKTDKDIWEEGWYDGIGNCVVVKLKGNKDGCKWLVKVGENVYPDPNGSICSAPEQAKLIGCEDVQGNQKNLAGCILRKAISEGYCLDQQQ
jgi:hypothetical protein